MLGLVKVGLGNRMYGCGDESGGEELLVGYMVVEIGIGGICLGLRKWYQRKRGRELI